MKYLFAVITTLLLASHANADDSARVKQLEATIRELTIQNAKLIRQNQNLKLDKGADTEQLPEAGKAAEQERVALEKALKDKLRQENLARLAGLSDTGASGRSPVGLVRPTPGKWSRPSSPTYFSTGQVSGNPVAEVEVASLPTGEILGRKLERSSGVKAWDDAVLRAIDRTGRLPTDTNGRAPSPILISFRPNDSSQ